MSTVVTLQNALDLPSPVTLHFENADFDIGCPYSPTSSLKGVLVRSRPSSMEITGDDLPSEFGQFGMTGNVRVPFLQAVPVRKGIPLDIIETFNSARDATPRDEPTLPSAARFATAPIRAVRRVLDDDEEEDEDADHATAATHHDTEATRRRTWPSMQRLRGRVSGIFQRRPTVTHVSAAPPPTPDTTAVSGGTTSTVDIVHMPPTSSRPRRTFSFSLRDRVRAGATTNSKVPAAHTPVGNVARARRVRRSRSFSGFTSMAHQVLAPIAEPECDGLDEVALEAYNTARGVGQFWVYEEDLGGAAAGLLERGVERAW
ncbi:hypothetical protein B0H14DRAFT_3127291 [Mycena olivaceomarginata]|nr:hypothetical protein B0H14DRAFT_3127291 [Mycena olivaceomarginata]